MATMDPNTKGDLLKFTNAAKAIIYDENRLRQLLPMLESRDGAIKAVQAIMSVIEQKKPIPPDVAPYLAVNTYMLLVDMAHNITGDDPDKDVVRSVVGELLTMASASHSGQEPETGMPPTDPAAPPGEGQPTLQPQGLIGRSMGV